MTQYIDIRDLEDDQLKCRLLGHSWDDNPTAQVNSDLYRTSRGVVAVRCTRCHTERFDYINHMMAVGKRYYRYSEGYRSVRGANGAIVRGEMFRRSLLIRSARRRANGKKRK